MKGRRILISVLVLLLTLAVGLSQADTPPPALPLAGGGLGGSGPLGTAASALRQGSGQAPLSTSFTYQGQLRQGGNPVNGTCDFQFSLWDAASGGAQIGTTQTATNVTVSNGLFTVQLDFGSAAFTGDARWLEIAVRCPAGSGSYTTLTPRQALTPAPYALALPGLWTQQNATSPNLIGGYSGNRVTAGVVGATIGGGGASGSINQVTANYATIGGGITNIASGLGATVGGGNSNTSSDVYATIGGGQSNWASKGYATVGGGNSNTASGNSATIPGGRSNTAEGNYSFAAGRRAKANHQGAFVWADSTDADFASTANDQFAVRANGGVVFSTGGASFRINGGDAWTSANDGSGSGLDADMLDGQDSSHYLDTLRGLSCSNGQVAKWNAPSSQWECANDQTGAGGDFWSLTGNSGTNPAANFLGTTDNQALELRVNNARALRLEPNATSPNLIGGYSGNSVTSGVVGATIGGGGAADDGWGNPALNRVTDDYGTVGGGMSNQAGDNTGTTTDSKLATVGGGSGNTASGSGAVVGGGFGNTASGISDTVGGGSGNTASGSFSTVGGGSTNTASGFDATVDGGRENKASGHSSTVGGGFYNTASESSSTVGGGSCNTASGRWATVGGGHHNTASGNYTTVSGGGLSNPSDLATGNRVTDDYGTVGGGGNNQAGDNAGTTEDAVYATVGGGGSNTASGGDATVGGGGSNTASGWAATIGGGEGNTASGGDATVGGGWGNTASGDAATIGGGAENVVTAVLATVGGGYSNTASGRAATVAGGERNTAQGDYSFAAGYRANASNRGCFTWGDSSEADVTCYVANGWVARASGGVYFYTNASYSSGVYVAAGGSSWNAFSDRATKENFTPVDGQTILEKLAALPVQEYNLKSQDPAILHIGLVAQDFSAAFRYGESDQAINMEDADGVALAAIQGLYELVQEKDGQITALEAEVSTLHQRNTDLEARVAALEQAVGAPPSSPSNLLGGWWPLFLGGLVVAAGVVVQRRHPGGGR
jgi:hypothetical protein